ncbi:hypothetical protein SNEBB_001374 [Seison nebaliae]|nr:hypothetical protein SNEBB_001374 [Seison nebaliae]
MKINNGIFDIEEDCRKILTFPAIMSLESTVICIDGSDFMRNGDYLPTRGQAQAEAVNWLAGYKIKANVENNVALIKMADKINLLSSFTNDSIRMYGKMHQMDFNHTAKPVESVDLPSAIEVANLALKHRQNKNCRPKIVVFIGSPLNIHNKERLNKLAKKLKKEKINVDIISYGEYDDNTLILNNFIEIVAGSEAKNSHLLQIPSGRSLKEAVAESGIFPISNPGNGLDNEPTDPDLEMALRLSLEEQHNAQVRNVQPSAMEVDGVVASSNPTAATTTTTNAAPSPMLGTNDGMNDAILASTYAGMSEDEQMRRAIELSLQEATTDNVGNEEEKVEENILVEEEMKEVEEVKEEEIVEEKKDEKKE